MSLMAFVSSGSGSVRLDSKASLAPPGFQTAQPLSADSLVSLTWSERSLLATQVCQKPSESSFINAMLGVKLAGVLVSWLPLPQEERAITSASPNTIEAVLPTHAFFAAAVFSIFPSPCFGRERAYT